MARNARNNLIIFQFVDFSSNNSLSINVKTAVYTLVNGDIAHLKQQK